MPVSKGVSVEQIKSWLSTLDPLKDWDFNNLDKLEEQIVDTVKECGYLNLPKLLDLTTVGK